MHSPLLGAAAQDKLTAGLCLGKHTYEDWPFIWVCTNATQMHCKIGLGTMHFPLLSAALQHSLAAGVTAATPIH